MTIPGTNPRLTKSVPKVFDKWLDLRVSRRALTMRARGEGVIVLPMTNPAEDNPYGYPAPPPLEEPRQAAVTPPTEVLGAFWGYVVAAVVTLVAGLLSLGQKQEVIDSVRAANKQGGSLTEDQINQVANLLITVVVVVAVIFAALYLLFAFKLRAGRNWARIVLTIIAALALLSLLFGRAGSVTGYIGELAAVIAAVLSYLPASNSYFTAAKASRQLR